MFKGMFKQVKFSVKSVDPISTSLRSTSHLSGWEFGALGVEYLFMAKSGQLQQQITEIDNDFRYADISVLNRAPQLKKESGRYRHQDVVPI